MCSSIGSFLFVCPPLEARGIQRDKLNATLCIKHSYWRLSAAQNYMLCDCEHVSFLSKHIKALCTTLMDTVVMTPASTSGNWRPLGHPDACYCGLHYDDSSPACCLLNAWALLVYCSVLKKEATEHRHTLNRHRVMSLTGQYSADLNSEWFRRKRSWPISVISWTLSGGTFGVQAESESKYFPNTSLELYSYTSQLSFNSLSCSGYYIYHRLSQQ
jgi:hypothetical protein